MTTTLLLRDAELELRRTAQLGQLSTLEMAFVAWLRKEPAPASLGTALGPPLRSYDDVALAALAEAAGWSTNPSEVEDGLRWLSEVALERMAGMPAPVVADGLAQLALGLAARERPWFAAWHDQVVVHGADRLAPPWLAGGGGLVRGAASACAAELRIALAARGVVGTTDADSNSFLQRLVRGELTDDPFHAQVFLVALDWTRRAAPVVLPGQGTPETAADLLRSVPRALQQWPWEEKPKTRNSRAAKWHIDNEYHVQALLWTILSPIFPDLKREEYAAQIGRIQPRVDFGIPSLRLLVEAKFARDRGALKNMVNEIAQDASNYFTVPGAYDSLLVFVWDNEGHSQDHDLVISGLRQFDRVSDAVIVGRPGHMTDVAVNTAGT